MNFISLVAMIVVSSKPEVILLPKYLYSSPKHCEAPIKLCSEKKMRSKNKKKSDRIWIDKCKKQEQNHNTQEKTCRTKINTTMMCESQLIWCQKQSKWHLQIKLIATYAKMFGSVHKLLTDVLCDKLALMPCFEALWLVHS